MSFTFTKEFFLEQMRELPVENGYEDKRDAVYDIVSKALEGETVMNIDYYDSEESGADVLVMEPLRSKVLPTFAGFDRHGWRENEFHWVDPFYIATQEIDNLDREERYFLVWMYNTEIDAYGLYIVTLGK